MKVLKENNLTQITASKNHFFANKELTEVYGTTIFLGKYSSESDFVEIDEATKNKILTEQEEKEKLELEREKELREL